MELKEIFPGHIWSVQYAGDSANIFSIRINQWRDIEYLDDYFYRHKQFIDNNSFWKEKKVTYQDVIILARKELSSFIRDINEYYNNSKSGKRPNLEDKFVLLEKPPYNEKKTARRKMYGSDISPAVFRLYAIKLESDEEGGQPVFIITGGAIKLTGEMRKMKELNSEYKRMLSVQDYLSKMGIDTKESLYTLKNDK